MPRVKLAKSETRLPASLPAIGMQTRLRDDRGSATLPFGTGRRLAYLLRAKGKEIRKNHLVHCWLRVHQHVGDVLHVADFPHEAQIVGGALGNQAATDRTKASAAIQEIAYLECTPSVPRFQLCGLRRFPAYRNLTDKGRKQTKTDQPESAIDDNGHAIAGADENKMCNSKGDR